MHFAKKDNRDKDRDKDQLFLPSRVVLPIATQSHSKSVRVNVCEVYLCIFCWAITRGNSLFKLTAIALNFCDGDWVVGWTCRLCWTCQLGCDWVVAWTYPLGCDWVVAWTCRQTIGWRCGRRRCWGRIRVAPHLWPGTSRRDLVFGIILMIYYIASSQKHVMHARLPFFVWLAWPGLGPGRLSLHQQSRNP